MPGENLIGPAGFDAFRARLISVRSVFGGYQNGESGFYCRFDCRLLSALLSIQGGRFRHGLIRRTAEMLFGFVLTTGMEGSLPPTIPAVAGMDPPPPEWIRLKN